MTPSEYQTLLYKIDKDILYITLNRPDKRNALNDQMVHDLNSLFIKNRENKDIIGIALTGSGEAFCAGADLTYLRGLRDKSYEENLQDSKNLKEMFWSIYSFPKPTAALINGPAVAGGCGLSTVFDIAIASKNAIFGYPEVKIGFVASIVSVFLMQKVGLTETKHLLYTGEMIDTLQAEKIGLIQQIAEPGELVKASDTFFSKLRKNSLQAILQTKRLLIELHQRELLDKLDFACQVNAESRQTSDFQEGLNSFLEKRKPIWEKT
jgi:methylglutaconyl-CoA hydratase